MDILIHYDEIGTKGKNRNYFEDSLIKNLNSIKNRLFKKVYKRYGKIICEDIVEKNIKNIKEILSFIPGVANFSFAIKCSLDIEKLKKRVKYLLDKEDFISFKINSKRSYKKFSKKSIEVNEEVGEFICNELNKKVNLVNPNIEVFIEIGEKEIFIFLEKFKGIGGLPIGTSGKMIASISGGIDSPVASYFMMKRGCKIIFVHIHNRNIDKNLVLDKIKRIVKKLSNIQDVGKLYVVPFDEIQKRIIINVPSKYRMIIYRRYMLKIIEEICEKEKCISIINGDSIG